MNLFDRTTFECSKIVTTHYSTSFTLGIKTLDKRYHEPIYAVYGFVRYADEIVDTFYKYDQALLLKEFKEDTFRAIEQGISLNPILHSFQQVVNTYDVDTDLIEAFFRSMEMDLHKSTYEDKKYEEYIYGSAEVVGLMCLRIFCEGNDDLYKRLRHSARHLGAAFQKVNFLRDLKSDYIDRGRIYFPGVDLQNFDSVHKQAIEASISLDFQEAYKGIVSLPKGAREGVYLAYVYYQNLFHKIRKTSAAAVMKKRIRIPNIQKYVLLFISYLRVQLNVL